jgi:predicted ATPase/DNA-binding CsgD family transcriptional regulator
VGRDTERASLRRIILDAAARLVTLTGPGGTGKTRLALAAVDDVQSGFRDGGCLVELASIAEPGEVAGAVAKACRAATGAEHQPVHEVRDWLDGRELLLVLDNCEHVAGGVADLLQCLLPECPGLRVLATSRQPLQIYGERLFPVRPLPLVSSLHVPLAEIGEIPSVALFVQRARAVVPDFALTEKNVADVAEICRLVDGLPLAIELAATRLRLFGPRALLNRLRDGIDILRLGLADVPSRQQTMRATILWSYELLTAPERQLLTCLGVFSDGFGLDAATAVSRLPLDQVEILLESLIDKGMLTATTGPDGEPRFLTLHTIQAFCVERLREAAGAEEVYDRHADYFLQVVVDAEGELLGERHATCVAKLVGERANLRAAYLRLQTRGDAETMLAFATGLWRFMFGQGHLQEGLRQLEHALDAAGERPGDRRYADALHAAGILAMAVGDYPEAEAYQRRAVAAYHQQGQLTGHAAALNHLGNLARIRGDLREARALCERSLALWQEAQDRQGAAVVLIDLALISLSRNDVAAAEEAVGFALPLFEAHGDERNACMVRALSGLVAYRNGNQAEAERACRDAASTVVEMMGSHPDTPFVLEALALVLAGRQQPDTDRAAVRLIAGAGVIRVETHSFACADMLPIVDRASQNLRGRIGDVGFDSECLAGRTMPLPTLVEQACRAAGAGGAVSAAQGAPWSGSGSAAQQSSAPGQLEGRATEQGADDRPDLTDKLADALKETTLTAREQEVVTLVASGMTNRQIARELNIAEWTAINHVRHAMRKLGLPSRVHVAQWAARQQL